jgi:hypothetical protein
MLVIIQFKIFCQIRALKLIYNFAGYFLWNLNLFLNLAQTPQLSVFGRSVDENFWTEERRNDTMTEKLHHEELRTLLYSQILPG